MKCPFCLTSGHTIPTVTQEIQNEVHWLDSASIYWPVKEFSVSTATDSYFCYTEDDGFSGASKLVYKSNTVVTFLVT